MCKNQVARETMVSKVLHNKLLVPNGTGVTTFVTDVEHSCKSNVRWYENKANEGIPTRRTQLHVVHGRLLEPSSTYLLACLTEHPERFARCDMRANKEELK